MITTLIRVHDKLNQERNCSLKTTNVCESVKIYIKDALRSAGQKDECLRVSPCNHNSILILSLFLALIEITSAIITIYHSFHATKVGKYNNIDSNKFVTILFLFSFSCARVVQSWTWSEAW